MTVGNLYGSGSEQIWLDDVQCNGNETSLAECGHSGWSVHNCGHSQDVSIICSDNTTRECRQPFSLGIGETDTKSLLA